MSTGSRCRGEKLHPYTYTIWRVNTFKAFGCNSVILIRVFPSGLDSLIRRLWRSKNSLFVLLFSDSEPQKCLLTAAHGLGRVITVNSSFTGRSHRRSQIWLISRSPIALTDSLSASSPFCNKTWQFHSHNKPLFGPPPQKKIVPHP